MLDADNQHPPMTCASTRAAARAAAYVARLAAHGIGARRRSRRDAAGACVLAEPLPVTQLPGFADGEVSVQDAAAQRAAPLLLGAGLRPARACSTPAPRPAARPRTCSNSPTSTCSRSTATRRAWRACDETLAPAAACTRAR